ncbi:hypothetical protein HD554DRAFT_2028044, partial [Boletus coccyginus]
QSIMTLPPGWIEQYDSNYNQTFWASLVDTQSDPPRATWVHPHEDEQFLAEQPEVKANEETSSESDLDAPPPYDVATEGRASGSGEDKKAGSSKRADPPDAVSGESSHAEHKRGVFGKLKDKAIGTKEEREEHKRIRAEQAARAEEQASEAKRRQLEERRRIRAEQALEEREAYMRAHGGYAPYHPSYGYGTGPGYGPGMGRGRGGDDTAALLLGGMAGGLLLGGIFGGF